MMIRLGSILILLILQACQSGQGPAGIGPEADAPSSSPTAAAPPDGITSSGGSDLAVGPLVYKPPTAVPSTDTVYVIQQPVEAVSDAIVQDLVSRRWIIIDVAPLVDGRRIIAEYSGPTADDIDCGMLRPARGGLGFPDVGIRASTPRLRYRSGADQPDTVDRELQLDGHTLIDLHASVDGTLIQRQDTLILTRFMSVSRGDLIVQREAESIRFDQGVTGQFSDDMICFANTRPPGAQPLPIQSERRIATAPAPEQITLSLRSPLGPPPFYRANQTLTFTAKVNRDAYLYCYYGEANGSVWQIYPILDNARVAGGTSVDIPGREAGFDIVLDRPGTQEEIFCFAAVTDLGARLPRGPGIGGLKPMPVASLNDIVVAYHNSGVEGIAEARLPIAIVAE